MRALVEAPSVSQSARPSFSGRPLPVPARPLNAGRCRYSAPRTVAVAAVDTKKQSRLAFVDLQPPDPILGRFQITLRYLCSRDIQ